MPKKKNKRISAFRKHETRVPRMPPKDLHHDHTYFGHGTVSGSTSSIEPSIGTDITSDQEMGGIDVTEYDGPTCITYGIDSMCDNNLLGSKIECHVAEQIELGTTEHPYSILKTELSESLPASYFINQCTDIIQICEVYPSTIPAVKMCITIDQTYHAKIFVHRIELSSNHDIWIGQPKCFNNVKDVLNLLDKLRNYNVCVGNYEEEYINITPIDSGISSNLSHEIIAYREGDFGAVRGTYTYNTTVRSVKCGLLVQSSRCVSCIKVRRTLYMKSQRQTNRNQENETQSLIRPGIRNMDLTKEKCIHKLKEQKDKIRNLQQEIFKMKRQFQKEVASSGVILNEEINVEMKDTMQTCQAEMEKSFPDSNCVQHYFGSSRLRASRQSP